MSTDNHKRSVHPDPRNRRYRLQEYSWIPPIITSVTIFVFLFLAGQSFLTAAAMNNVPTFASINGMAVVGALAVLMSTRIQNRRHDLAFAGC